MPAGPSPTTSARFASSATSSLPLHTSTPGTPSPRNPSTAANAGRSPRSSPAYSTAPAPTSRTYSDSATPLSIPGGRSSSTIRPGSTISPCRAASSDSGTRSASNAACGSAARRVWTATARPPFSSTQVPRHAPTPSSTPGSSARTAATPGCGAGALTVPVTASHRSAP